VMKPNASPPLNCRGTGPLVSEVLGGAPLPAGFHVGLGLGPVRPPEDPTTGKCTDAHKGQWIEALEKVEIAADYKDWFTGRWRPAVARMAACEVRTSSRLLVGAGDPSCFDVGLRIHHTWGVPFIPGSSLKGLLSHWLDVVYGPAPEIDQSPLDAGHQEMDRAPFRRATFSPGKSSPKYGPGKEQRAIFGAPNVKDDKAHLLDMGLLKPGRATTACRGHVHFHDALMVPELVASPFAADVLTPHHSLYYRGLLDANDYESPVPVSFLTVNRGVHFLVAVTADRGWEQWAQFSLNHLCEALDDWGVGAKTAAGYGRCEVVKKDAITRVRDESLQAEMKAWLEEVFPSLMATNDGPVRFVDLIEKTWGDRLKAMSALEKGDAIQAIKTYLSGLKKAKRLTGRAYEGYQGAVKEKWGGP
jgi:CRISPR-associated protein Cmr6